MKEATEVWEDTTLIDQVQHACDILREEHTWPAAGQQHLGTCQSHGGTSVMEEERGERNKAW